MVIGGSQTVLGSSIKFFGKPELFRLILKFYFYKILFCVQVIKDQGTALTPGGGCGYGMWDMEDFILYLYLSHWRRLALFNKLGC